MKFDITQYAGCNFDVIEWQYHDARFTFAVRFVLNAAQDFESIDFVHV